MQWHMQAGNITTNLKVKLYFTLPSHSAMDVVTWKCHVDDSARGRYDAILGRDLLTGLWLNLKVSEYVIEADDGTLKGSATTMVNVGTYIFKYLNTGKITPEESFTNAYVKELYESYHVRTTTKRLRIIVDAKYEK